MMAVPSRTFFVFAPHQASGVSTSEPYASAVQIESKPSRSASATASSTPGGGPAVQYPVFSPSLSSRATPTTLPLPAGARIRDLHEQLAPVGPGEEVDERARRVLEPVADVLAIVKLALHHERRELGERLSGARQE